MSYVTEAGRPDPPVHRHVLERVADSWADRLTLIHHLRDIESPSLPHDPAVPDYPVSLLPFAEHPDFAACSPEQHQQILTMAWLVYNERVIETEEHIANPTFRQIVHGTFPGATSFEIRRAVQQAHVDETWHTYMHMMASQRTRLLRAIGAEPRYPATVTYQRLLDLQQATPDRWERQLQFLVWTTVSEVTVNAYLTLLARAEGVQPLHVLVPQWHARDESAHSSVVVEVAKALFCHMTHAQRDRFVQTLPRGLEAFVAHDFEAWKVILRHAGVAAADDIIGDCERGGGSQDLVHDFSGMRRLVRELDLADRIDFDAAGRTDARDHL